MLKQKKYFWMLAMFLATISVAVGCAPAAPQNAGSDEGVEAQIRLEDPYARATTVNGAVFVTLVNEGDVTDVLLGAESGVAETIELHETKMGENDMMQMSPVPNIEVPAGSSVALEPGGKHIMLIDLKQDLATGDRITLTLNFERSGPMTLEAEVREGVMMSHGQEGDMAGTGHEAGMAEQKETAHDHEQEMTVELAPVLLAEGEKLRVVATTGIIADIAGNIGGDMIELTGLLPVGADPHTFQPTPQDLVTVTDAHLILANGLGLEGFLEGMIRNAGGEAVLVSVSDGIEPRELEMAEDHDHGGGDPHTWTTPANAVIFVHNIEEALAALDPANAATYEANARLYEAQLIELDEWVKAQIEMIPPENRKLVTDHTTFGYYADRYGLEQIGAIIPSFSTAAEPSAQELAALEDAIRQHNAKAVFVGTSVNPSLAEQVANDTGIQMVFLYTGSLGPEGSGVETYLDYIRYNTNAIVDALQ